MRTRTNSACRTGGFTIVEMVIATTIFSVLGYVLMKANEMGQDSHGAVADSVERSQVLRSTRSTLADELKTANEDSVTLTVLPSGNNELTFQMPITVAGTNTWGVHDRTWGNTEAQQNREDWSVRYTVQNYIDGEHSSCALVRQILDDKADLQDEEVITEGLSQSSSSPGFQVIQTGALWEITVRQQGYDANTCGEEATLYVRTRN